uniref:Uncharacterized protein n=1 Tax=Peromyscus maniculatus bairdii TaxID=230844 RepID=A0A8C8W382_PERMB
MWYPCVSTMCHISIMVTRTSFYDAYYYTVFHLTCKILQNSFSFFPFHIYTLSKPIMHSLFSFSSQKYNPGQTPGQVDIWNI